MIFRRNTWSVDSGILIFIWYIIPSHASILSNSFITPWSFKSPWFSVWRQTYSALSNVNIGKISEWKVSVLDAPRIRFPAMVPAVRTALLPIFEKWSAIKIYQGRQTKWCLGYLPRGPRFGLRSTALSMKVWIVTEPPITRIWWPFSSLTHRFFNSGYCCRFRTFEFTLDENGSLQP